MAPSTPTPAPQAQQTPDNRPPQDNKDRMETDDEEDDDDDEEEIIAPSSHEEEVKKLKKKLKFLSQQHNELLKGARNDSTVNQVKFGTLEKQVNNLMQLAKDLGKATENNTRTYREHIENTSALMATGKDPGEILRPRQPEPYNGDADKLQGFLTSLRNYQLYYPAQFSTDELKIRHATGFLKDKALRWFEPIIRDYVNNPPEKRKRETRFVYENYGNFEKELRDAFGLVDEKRLAEISIRKLKQRTAASTYAAEYRYQASRLDWNEEAHMSQYYLGLKPEVKDALVNIRPKPTGFNELVAISVEIDDQQYERRRERQAEKQGITDRTQWTKKFPRANQGRPRQVDTSYGTHAGPMTLGAIQKDMSKITCFNCNEKGHMRHKCPHPRQTQNKYQGKKEWGTTNTGRTQPARTLGMTRSGYDGTYQEKTEERIPEYIQQLQEQKKELQDKLDYFHGQNIRKRENEKLRIERLSEEKKEDHRIKARQAMREKRENPEFKAKENKKARERRQKTHETKTLGIFHKGTSTTITPDIWNLRDPTENKGQWSKEQVYYTMEAKTRSDTMADAPICVRMQTLKQVEDPTNPVPTIQEEQDAIRYPSNKEHYKIAWISCTRHYCDMHRSIKTKHDCFPVPTEDHQTANAYRRVEFIGYAPTKYLRQYEVVQFSSDFFAKNKEYHKIMKRSEINQWRKQISTSNGTCPENEEDREHDQYLRSEIEKYDKKEPKNYTQYSSDEVDYLHDHNGSTETDYHDWHDKEACEISECNCKNKDLEQMSKNVNRYL